MKELVSLYGIRRSRGLSGLGPWGLWLCFKFKTEPQFECKPSDMCLHMTAAQHRMQDLVLKSCVGLCLWLDRFTPQK